MPPGPTSPPRTGRHLCAGPTTYDSQFGIGAFSAGSGYDEVTGLGSYDGANLNSALG